MGAPLLKVDHVNKTFRTSRWPAAPLRTVAIDDVSLQVERGESVGIAGESGSGKSTLVGAVCGLVRPDSGRLALDGTDLYPRGRYDRRAWKTLQLVFQDPYTSLNPAMSIVESAAEPARFWRNASVAEARGTALMILDQVGINKQLADRRPGSLSGGQLQRVSIARALACSPELLVLDESVSALDVSVQAQILELLVRLRAEHNLTYVLVSHDISVLRLVCDRVVVMRHGRVVEQCTSADLTVDKVTHPYTRELLAAVPTFAAASAR